MLNLEAFEETYMKRFFGFAILIASLAVPAFAAKNSKTVTFTDAVKVGSTQLPAGEYKVSWTATGSSAQVTIAIKGGTSITVPAKLVDAKNGHVAVLTNSVGGVEVLESIQLDNLSLVIGGATAAGE
jgi:hypothetical protein